MIFYQVLSVCSMNPVCRFEELFCSIDWALLRWQECCPLKIGDFDVRRFLDGHQTCSSPTSEVDIATLPHHYAPVQNVKKLGCGIHLRRSFSTLCVVQTSSRRAFHPLAFLAFQSLVADVHGQEDHAREAAGQGTGNPEIGDVRTAGSNGG